MARRPSIFSATGALRPERSAFNLSESVKFDCVMGKLVPVWFREVYPGDVIKYGAQAIVRLSAMIAPAFVGMDYKVELFYMPSRLLMGKEFDKYFRSLKEDHSAEGTFEDFISGGEDGNYGYTDGEQSVFLPTWTSPDTSKYSLWDYFGMPIGVAVPNVLDFPRRMYNAVWNEYYRNENVEDEIASTNGSCLNRNWKRDYFTSCLPFQQRGIGPALPVNVTGEFSINGINAELVNPRFSLNGYSSYYNPIAKDADTSGTSPFVRLSGGDAIGTNSPAISSIDGTIKSLGSKELQLSATTFDVSDLRLAFQIQKWMERNARAGVRYTEFLRAHFGVSPHDSRLDRPQYIGSIKNPIVVSEVLQTSATDTTSPQGNLAGHGIGAGSGYIGSYRVEEYGYVMALFSIVPQRAEYFQGVPRELMRRTRYDFYSPEFAHLSEQAVEQSEIYASASDSENRTVFGYQGRYNELRTGRDRVAGDFKDSLLYWSFARKFDAAPTLSSDFALMDSSNDDFNRIFAVQESEGQQVPNFMVNFQNVVKAIRPMPYMAEPGLIDHF